LHRPKFMTASTKATLRTVAAQANVSTGTVSMVINGSPLVAKATRAHVLQVIRETGYVYDRSAAQLRKKRSSIVGVAICNLLNPFFAEVAAGMESSLADAGKRLVLGNADEVLAKQDRFLETLREHQVEGILWMPTAGTSSAAVKRVLGWNIPIVMVSRYVSGVDVDYVGHDNRLATIVATEHLLACGHRRIAFIGANAGVSSGRDRVAGFLDRMKTAKLAVSKSQVLKCEASREGGFKAIQVLMAGKDPPTAVVCYNDVVAFGVMLGLRKCGLEPGRDCAVVGSDDMSEAGLWQPALTTMAVNAREIGKNAASLIERRIIEPDAPPQSILLPPQLVVRESSRPPTTARKG
jgi:LacI family transcriptional regulator